MARGPVSLHARLISTLAFLAFGAAAAPGDRDPGFGNNGLVTLSFAGLKDVDVQASARLEDGGILVAGTIDSLVAPGTRQTVLGRLTSQGVVDTSFGTQGWSLIQDGQECVPAAIAPDASARVLVACNLGYGSMRLLRFGTTGAVDYSFYVDTSQGFGAARALKVLADGSILVAGTDGYPKVGFVNRYFDSGSLDWSFGAYPGGNGRAIVRDPNLSDNIELNAMAVQSDGSIVVAGSKGGFYTSDMLVARLGANGQVDAAFGLKTWDHMGQVDVARAVLVDGQDRILVAGKVHTGFSTGRFAFWRLLANGDTDTTYGTAGGKSVFDLTSSQGYEASVTTLTPLPDGALAGGYYNELMAGNIDFAFVRLDAQGLPVPSFGGCIDSMCGSYIGPAGAESEPLVGVALQSDAFVAVGRRGSPGTRAVVSRHDLATGQPFQMPSGGTRAAYSAYVVPPAWPSDAIVQPDGKLVVAGNVGGDPASRFARFNLDGSLDTTFGSGGYAFLGGVEVLALQADGKIVGAGGAFNPQAYRLLPNGSPDPSFPAWVTLPSANATRGVAVQSDGKIVVLLARIVYPPPGGTTRVVLGRLNADGSTDASFGNNGEVLLDIRAGMYEQDSSALRILPDGKILVVTGTRLLPVMPYHYAMGVYRLMPNGSLDPTWGDAGLANYDVGDSAWPNDIGITADGKVVVAGSCHETANVCLVRFGTNGSLDTTFGNGGFIEHNLAAAWDPSQWCCNIGHDRAFILGIDGSGRLVIGGDVGGWTAIAARLLPDGAIDTSFHGNGQSPGLFGSEGRSGGMDANGNMYVFGADYIGAWYVARVQGGGALVTPETTITAGPGSTSGSSVSVSFTSDTPGATFECGLDAASYAACVSPVALSGLANGPHTFRVRAKASGVVDPTPATANWTVDVTPPETTIGAAPSGLVNSRDATITFSANETSTFECKLDAADFAPCTSPVSLTNLADGPHAFQVRAKDAAGNIDATPASASWTVDATAPETTLGSAPSGSVPSSSATIVFSSPDTSATFECKLDGGGFSACTSPVNLTGLAEGAHTYQVRAKDAAGNIDATPAIATWTVDTVAPETTITSAPPALVNQASATIAFTASEASTFECRLDGAAFAACASPVSYGALADGSHTVQVRARDSAGNLDATPAQATWTVDATPPDTTIGSGPSGVVTTPTASFTFTATESAAFQCRLDGAAFASCSSPAAYASLADGSHTFEVRAIDNAGNVDSTPAARTWTVDTTAESTITSAPPAASNSTSATFAFTSEVGATFTCKLDSGAAAACTSPKAYSGLAQGAHTFTVTARDPYGNVEQTPSTFTWTVDTSAPNTTITSGPNGNQTVNTATFTFTSNEGGVTFECSLDSGGWTACTSPTTYANLANGSHNFKVRARDAAGNVDSSPPSRNWSIK